MAQLQLDDDAVTLPACHLASVPVRGVGGLDGAQVRGPREERGRG